MLVLRHQMVHFWQQLCQRPRPLGPRAMFRQPTAQESREGCEGHEQAARYWRFDLGALCMRYWGQLALWQCGKPTGRDASVRLLNLHHMRLRTHDRSTAAGQHEGACIMSQRIALPPVTQPVCTNKL
eukprot:27162-Amphidinium_carterae.5